MDAGSAARTATAARAPGKLKIEYIKLADLQPYERNPRLHSDEQIDQIAASIEEFGWSTPIVINGANGIVAGHGRALAAARMRIDPRRSCLVTPTRCTHAVL